MNTSPGPLLFARYAYAPNALGYCGADEPRTLLEYGDAKESDRGLAELARTFEGAWPYLQLIASANRIEDPLDPRVVDAYWSATASSIASARMHSPATWRIASGAASAAAGRPSSTPWRQVPCRTTPFTSSPCTPGSA
jgi:Family of unknown function (DUF6390)